MSNNKNFCICHKRKALTKVTQYYFVLGHFNSPVPCYLILKWRRQTGWSHKSLSPLRMFGIKKEKKRKQNIPQLLVSVPKYDFSAKELRVSRRWKGINHLFIDSFSTLRQLHGWGIRSSSAMARVRSMTKIASWAKTRFKVILSTPLFRSWIVILNPCHD